MFIFTNFRYIPIFNNVRGNHMKKTFKDFIDEPATLTEIARMNVDEINGALPMNKYDVRIWSNEHEPAHIHICAPSRKNPEYEVMFDIETGEVVGIKFDRKNRASFDFLVPVVKKWLDEKSAIDNTKTNREMCRMQWKMHQN